MFIHFSNGFEWQRKLGKQERGTMWYIISFYIMFMGLHLLGTYMRMAS